MVKKTVFLLQFIIIPISISIALIAFGPLLTYASSLISRVVLACFFFAVMVLGLVLAYRKHRLFIQNGNLSRYGIALGFLLLAVFSAAASLSFISNNSTVIGWLVQVGTLFSAAWMLVFAFHKNDAVEADRRNDGAFLYPVLVIIFSAAISWLIFIFSDFLPVAVSVEDGWGKELLFFRALATILFFIIAFVLIFRKDSPIPNVLPGAILLLAIGSAGVTYLYWFDVLGNHPLIWFNRALTLISFWIVTQKQTD